MTGIAVRGTGRFLPERVVENEEYTAFLDTSDEWIRSHTGIRQRRVALDEPTWYMGAMAAEQALEAAGVDADEIDLIVCTTISPDYAYPSTACLIQNHLGAERAYCMDLAAACAGFPYALDLCHRYLVTGGAETILLVSAESLTQKADYQDRASCILFGDGAGACVLSGGEGRFGSDLRSKGDGAPRIYARHPRQKLPFFDRATDYSMDPFPPALLENTHMDGHDVYRFATRAMPEVVRAACDKAGIALEELDLLIPHQANLRIIQKAARNLRMPMEKICVNIDKYGNTSSASIPICLDECVRSGRLQTGDRFCVVGFGAGLVYGACTLEYHPAPPQH